MKIEKITKLEDCFDGSFVYSYEFTGTVDESMMKAMAEGEKLQYFPNFSKPFYKIFTRDGLQIKGIVGEYNIEVTFPVTDQPEKKKRFEANLKLLL